MSGSAKPAKKQSIRNRFFGKRGYTIIVVLAAVILIISIITLSYSWYSPLSQPGTSMNYSANVKIRSEDCTIIGTFPAESENALPMSGKTGNLEESFSKSSAADDVTVQLITTVPQDAPEGTTADTSATGQIYYFRTKIQNNDVQPTNVSLYLKSAPTKVNGETPGASFSKFGIGVASPSNSYHTFTTSQTDVCIVRNAFIRGKNDEKYQNLYVDWFVRITDSSVKIDFTQLYLRYN